MDIHALKHAMQAAHPASPCYIRIVASGYRESWTHPEMSLALDAAYTQSQDGPIVAYVGCTDHGQGLDLGEAGLTLAMMNAARAAVAQARSRSGSMSAKVQGFVETNVRGLVESKSAIAKVVGLVALATVAAAAFWFGVEKKTRRRRYR